MERLISIVVPVLGALKNLDFRSKKGRKLLLIVDSFFIV